MDRPLSPGELLARLAAARLHREPPAGPVAAVVPAGRHGLHVAFDGGPGVRLDTRPGRGALLLLDRRPPRIRGGRGAWPPLAGLADRLLRGSRLLAVSTCSLPPAVALWFPGEVVLEWVAAPGGGSLVLREGGEVREGIGRVPPPAIPAWEPPPADAPLPDRLVLAGPPGFDPAGEPRASWAGRLELREPAPGEEGAPFLEAGAAWYAAALEAERLASLRRRGLRRLAAEGRRARRALAAIEREEGAAPDPAALRRRADALLAAGPALAREEGVFVVPDPWEPGRRVRVEAEPPGAPPHRVAERLYRRAAKAERGIAARARRREELAARLALLAEVAAALERADTAGEILAAGERFPELGLPVPSDEERLTGAVRRPAPGGRDLPRVLRSPSGYEVLVGRSARGNDRLTFHLAGPDDWWFHVRGRPGAHVILRGAGRGEPPEEDLLFAARAAARGSGAPAGERVEVWVTRRRHVRKPRGAPPGTVTVRRARTVLVEVPPPGNPGIPGGSR